MQSSSLVMPVLIVVSSVVPGGAAAQLVRAPIVDPGALAALVSHDELRPEPAGVADPSAHCELVTLAPTGAPATDLCGAVRAAIMRGMLTRDDATRRHSYAEAEADARRALALSPQSVDARYWLAAAEGMRTTEVGFRDRLRMGREIYDLAQAILAADPNDAGGHYIMGRLNIEIMKMSGLSRFIAGRLLGAALIRRASWHQAEVHLEAAVRSNPRSALDHLALARVYAATHRDAQARTQIRFLFYRTDPTPITPLLQAQARALLRTMSPTR